MSFVSLGRRDGNALSNSLIVKELGEPRWAGAEP